MRRTGVWILLCAIGAISLIWTLTEDRALAEEPAEGPPRLGSLGRTAPPWVVSRQNRDYRLLSKAIEVLLPLRSGPD